MILLPVGLFLSLSVTTYTLIKPNLGALRPPLREQCQAGLSPNFLPVTNTNFDKFLCVLISLFHIGLEPESSPFMAYFFATCLPAIMLFVSVESSRKGRRFIVSYAGLISGMFGQVLTVGVVLPIYWIYFILSARRVKGKVTEAHAEASLFGVLIGWVVPSLALFTMPDPSVTAIFQIAPLISFVCQFAHIVVRSPSTVSHSGFRTVQGAYIVIFIIASSMHLNTLMRFSSIEDFKSLFVPTLYASSIQSAAMNVFQVDFYATVLGCLLASLWFARSQAEVAKLAIWAVVGSLLFSPGAAFVAAALWRESYLEEALIAKEVIKKE